MVAWRRDPGSRIRSVAGRAGSVLAMRVIVVVIVIIADDLVDQVIDDVVKRHRVLLQADGR